MRKLEFLDRYLAQPNGPGTRDWREATGLSGGNVMTRALARVGLIVIAGMGLAFGG